MTMIKTVARALARNQLSALGKEAFDKNEYYYVNNFSLFDRDAFEAQAKIAIDAMREPLTKLMNIEGVDINTSCSIIHAINKILKV